MAKPTTIPQWASLDQVDPTSGKNNVVEPTTAFKEYGWPRKSRPVRQYLNWLGRIIYQWINWIDIELEPLVLTIEADLDQEITDRINGDNSLAGDIASETTARQLADTGLQNNIDSEETAREGADTTLQGNIDTTNGRIDDVEDRLDDYDADTIDLSGIMELDGFASNENVNFYAQIKRNRASNLSPGSTLTEVILYLPEVLATSTAAYLRLVSATIPADLRPDRDDVHVPVVLQNTGTTQLGFMKMSTTGDYTFTLADGSDPTVGGSKGLVKQEVRYFKSIT